MSKREEYERRFVPAVRRNQWDTLPWYGQMAAIHFNAYRYATPVVGSLLAGLLTVFVTSWWQAIIVATVTFVAVVIVFLGKVPAGNEEEDPNVGLPVVAGVRIPRTFQPGYYLGAPFMRVILFSAAYLNRDVIVSGVRTRLHSLSDETNGNATTRLTAAIDPRRGDVPPPMSGGKVDVHTSFTVQPATWGRDPWVLIDIDNAGGIEAALKILIDAISKIMRQVGRRVTWLEATFATDILSMYLIAQATGKWEFSPGRHIFDSPTDEEIQAYLEEAQLNGFSDAKGLGLKIRRIDVTQVEPKGKLADAAEKAVTEELRRQGLQKTVLGLAEAVKTLKEGLGRNHGMSGREILDRIQAEEEGVSVTRRITQIEVPDADKLVQAFGQILATTLGGRKGGSNGQ